MNNDRYYSGTDFLKGVVMSLPVMERNARLAASGRGPGPEWPAFCHCRIAELTWQVLQTSRSACA